MQLDSKSVEQNTTKLLEQNEILLIVSKNLHVHVRCVSQKGNAHKDRKIKLHGRI